MAASAPAPSGESTLRAWQATHDRAQAAYVAGDLDSAERDARAALQQARTGQGENASYMASSLNVLALVRQRQGHVDEAIALLRQALDHCRGEGAHENAAGLGLNLGQALEARGRSDAATQAFQESFDRARRLPDTPDAARLRQQALQGLARTYAATGRATEAATQVQHLLDTESALPSAEQADALERLATLQREQGDLPSARRAGEQALALRDASIQPDSNALLRSLAGLAATLDRMGLHDEAAPLHQRAVALLEASVTDELALADHLNELGLRHLQRKEFTTAQPLLERALALVSLRLPQSLEVARITANLAQLHEANDEGPKARRLHEQALALYAVHGEQPEALRGQAQALNAIAGLDYRRRRIAVAESQFLRALALAEQADGPQSPRLLPVLENLVTLYRGQRRPFEAAAYARRVEQLGSMKR